MTRFLDDPAFSRDLFFPRPDHGRAPDRARDVMVALPDGARVHARVHDGPVRPAAAVVLFHGNGEIVADYDAIAGSFAAAGARLAVVDFRGYGRSTGTPTLAALLADARPSLDALLPHLTLDGVPLPVIVMGRSLGSACAAELARSLPHVAAGFVLESGFADLVAFARRRGVTLSSVDEADRAVLCPLRKLARSRAPVLVLHGAADEVVASEEGVALHAAAAAIDKRVFLVPGRGHNDLSLDPRYWHELAAFVARVAHAADRRAGSLVAQALGDALGFLVEGAHPVVCARFAKEALRSPTPPAQRRGPFRFGQYSDDTQLARELALSIVGGHAWDPARFALRVAHLFASDTIVGRGRATEAAALRLIAGAPWQEAGEPAPSAGNGAAMRAAPVGLAFSAPEERRRVADEQARVTHLDPRARAAAVLVADVVADACTREGDSALAGVGTSPWCAALATRVEGMDPVLAEGLRRLPATLAGPPDQAAAAISAVAAPPRHQAHRFEEWHGISPFATPSALYAVYSYARSPGDPEAVLQRAVAVGGDVDTVAAMAGAMVGAAVGLGRLGPRLTRWAEHLEDQGTFGFRELVALGHALV